MNPGRGEGGGRRTRSHERCNLMVQCSVKSSTSVRCSPAECSLCSFHEQFAVLKLKHALWFAAAIGNMQLRYVRWAHPHQRDFSGFLTV